MRVLYRLLGVSEIILIILFLIKAGMMYRDHCLHPMEYIVMSAPWHLPLQMLGAALLIILAAITVARYVIRRRLRDDHELPAGLSRPKKVLLTVAALVVAAGVFILWDNTRIVTTEYQMESSRIDGPVRIVQISDFHECAKLGEKLVQRVRESSPQFIVITGDYFDGVHTDHDYAFYIADQLIRIAPVYFVTGNHEIADLTSEYRDELKERGIEILSGEKVSLGNNVDLYGIEDPLFNIGVSDELQKLHVDKDRYNILLSHRPEAFLTYTKSDFDLVLTGHAHGGQIRIPFVGGLAAPGQGFFPEYDKGAYEGNGTTMIVSRGIGNSLIPVRINNPAELVLIKLSSLGSQKH